MTEGDEPTGRWLHSGRRRDVCVVVASLDRPTAQDVKSDLARHYDDRIEPKTFYGILDALVDGGHLRRETDGIHDRYALTAAGRRAMDAHFAWVDERLDRGAGAAGSDTDAGDRDG